jgi:hypothetical protein
VTHSFEESLSHRWCMGCDQPKPDERLIGIGTAGALHICNDCMKVLAWAREAWTVVAAQTPEDRAAPPRRAFDALHAHEHIKLLKALHRHTDRDEWEQVVRRHVAGNMDQDPDLSALDGPPHHVESSHQLDADLKAEIAERARRRARRTLDEEERGRITVPSGVSLKEMLTLPEDPVRWRIDGWLPVDGRVICAASRKTGKTTLNGNVVRALADGDLFLGCCPVTDVAGSIVVIDNEMSPDMLRRWYQDLRVVNADRVHLFTLRGQGAALDIIDARVRAEWVARLRELPGGTSVLLLDCLQPAIAALGLSENSNDDVSRFLVAFDALKYEAGIGETFIWHHSGHVEERSRGASRLRDWPDVEWRYMRERSPEGEEIDAGVRFLAAYGRDVDVPEARLDYDPATRRLTYVGGDRRRHRIDRHAPAAQRIVVENPGITAGDLKEMIKAETAVANNSTLVNIVARAEELGLVHHVVDGVKKNYFAGSTLGDQG